MRTVSAMGSGVGQGGGRLMVGLPGVGQSGDEEKHAALSDAAIDGVNRVPAADGDGGIGPAPSRPLVGRRGCRTGNGRECRRSDGLAKHGSLFPEGGAKYAPSGPRRPEC